MKLYLIYRTYVDIVLNHMTGDHDGAVGTGGSTAQTYNKDYPAVPFHNDDFHPTCSLDNYNDPNQVMISLIVFTLRSMLGFKT